MNYLSQIFRFTPSGCKGKMKGGIDMQYQTDHIQQIHNQSENNDIPEKTKRNSSLPFLLFELKNFPFLIVIIDSIFNASGTCHQNSNQWQCSIMCLRLYHVTSILQLPLEGVLVTYYGRISYIYTFWYNFETVLYQFLKTGTSDRCLIEIVQLLRFSGFSLYSLSFFLYSPFKYYGNQYHNHY